MSLGLLGHKATRDGKAGRGIRGGRDGREIRVGRDGRDGKDLLEQQVHRGIRAGKVPLVHQFRSKEL